MDMHTHFLRDDTRIQTFIAQRESVGKAGWNPAIKTGAQTIEDLKFANYIKEIYLNSDTKVACISGAPSEIPGDWFLTNEMKAKYKAIELLKPDSMKGYTIGDNTNKHLSKHPWLMDDEKLVYPAYEKLRTTKLFTKSMAKAEPTWPTAM
jgi:hypothetical protein